MKKILFITLTIISFTLLSCTKSKKETNTESDSKVQEEVQSKVVSEVQTERAFITNELAGDCPPDIKATNANVNYGEIRHVKYYSETCKMDRYYCILLPAGYDADNKEKKFPVIYFQHGIFGDEKCMIYDDNNKFKQITKNLFDEGKAPEVIMVFGNMYASQDPAQKPAFNVKDTLPYDNFLNELTDDLMPHIEATYNVKTGRKNTAVCGFSMGGRESIYIGLKRPDLFGYIGAIAPAPGLVPAKDWAMEHPGNFIEDELKFSDNAELPYFFMICCGTNDNTVGKFPKSYHKIFQNNKVEHTWFEVIGADHNSNAIRSGFYWFMNNVFKAE